MKIYCQLASRFAKLCQCYHLHNNYVRNFCQIEAKNVKKKLSKMTKQLFENLLTSKIICKIHIVRKSEIIGNTDVCQSHKVSNPKSPQEQDWGFWYLSPLKGLLSIINFVYKRNLLKSSSSFSINGSEIGNWKTKDIGN